MADFKIFIDSQNYLAIVSFPDDHSRPEEDMRVSKIDGVDQNETNFTLADRRVISVKMSFVEMQEKLFRSSQNKGVEFEGTEHAPRS